MDVLEQATQAVCELEIHLNANPDDARPVDADAVLSAMNLVRRLGEIHRDLKDRLEAASIQWIEVNGDLTDGEVRYYVAPNKSTKCVDLRGTFQALLDKSGGDLDSVVLCLSSGAFKPSATKEVLGDLADSLFVTEVTKDLKTGKPTGPRVQKHDPRFNG